MYETHTITRPNAKSTQSKRALKIVIDSWELNFERDPKTLYTSFEDKKKQHNNERNNVHSYWAAVSRERALFILRCRRSRFFCCCFVFHCSFVCCCWFVMFCVYREGKKAAEENKTWIKVLHTRARQSVCIGANEMETGPNWNRVKETSYRSDNKKNSNNNNINNNKIYTKPKLQ